MPAKAGSQSGGSSANTAVDVPDEATSPRIANTSQPRMAHASASAFQTRDLTAGILAHEDDAQTIGLHAKLPAHRARQALTIEISPRK
jgi:hypothetical protein